MRDAGWTTTSEISLRDAVVSHPLLHFLQLSKHGQHGYKIASAVTKTAAAMELLRANVEHFERGVPSDESQPAQKMAARCNHCMN